MATTPNDRLDRLTHKQVHTRQLDGLSYSATHPDLASHDTMGLATDAELAAHVGAADPHTVYALDTDLSTHAAAADPHTGYQKESERAAASGYASLDAGTKVPTAQLGSGAASATTYLRGDQTWATPAGGGETDPIVWMGGF